MTTIQRVRRRPSASATRSSADVTPSCFNLRCRADRSMPTNCAVREMLPPNRNNCDCKYCVSNKSRASRNGSDMMSAPGSILNTCGAREPISGGSMSARIASDRTAGRHDHQPVHQIAQLPHIARPVVRLQRRQRIGRQFAHRHARRLGRAGDENGAPVPAHPPAVPSARAAAPAPRPAGRTDPRGTARWRSRLCRSRFVVEMTRTSTLTRLEPPTRSKL